MVRAISFLALLFFLVIPTATSQTGIKYYGGSNSGQRFRDLKDEVQRAYAAGILDGMLLAGLFEAPDANVARLYECVQDMTDTQIAAITSKYLDNHPERWHYSAHIIILNALRDSCPKLDDVLRKAVQR